MQNFHPLPLIKTPHQLLQMEFKLNTATLDPTRPLLLCGNGKEGPRGQRTKSFAPQIP